MLCKSGILELFRLLLQEVDYWTTSGKRVRPAQHLRAVVATAILSPLPFQAMACRRHHSSSKRHRVVGVLSQHGQICDFVAVAVAPLRAVAASPPHARGAVVLSVSSSSWYRRRIVVPLSLCRHFPGRRDPSSCAGNHPPHIFKA